MKTSRNLVTTSPFNDLARMFFNDEFFVTPSLFENKRSGLSNISENDNEYIVELSAPGFKKEDIKIELENDVLKIYSDYENNKEDKNDGYYRREFIKSSFERSFTMPKDANKEEISAEMIDGILKVIVPKQEQKKENLKITIK